jgi:hypothetical protein
VWVGKDMGSSGFWDPCFVFVYSSAVIVEGACVTDFRGVGLCMVGTVG